MMRRPATLGMALAGALALPALAQSPAPGGVPAWEPPPPAVIQRDGQVAPPLAPLGSPDAPSAFSPRADLVANFASAYAGHGKPRLALYWNRELTDTLNQWYSDTRVVARTESNYSNPGPWTPSGTSETTVEIQRRAQNSVRPQASESFDWEFQDGFLAPFLEAGATVLDRTTIIRLAGAELSGGSANTVEMRALQGKADYLLEVLGANNSQSTLGYELRARIIEINTGRIVAYVNSKSLKEWNPEKSIVATNRGFQVPDEDDESFGPIAEEGQFKATGSGFELKRKPPKLQKVAQNLAYNAMEGMMRQWK